MKKVTIPLKEVIELDDKKYTELILKPFRAKHFKYLPDEFFDTDPKEAEDMSAKDSVNLAIKMMPLIAGLANVDEEVVGELGVEDLMEVMGKLAPFLGECLKTGST